VRLPVVVLDGLRDFIKVPLLCSYILSPSLEPHIVGAMAFSNSLHWKSRSDIERSIDIESKFFIKTLSFSFFCFIKIDDSPFLISFTCISCNTDCLTFFIFRACNIKNFTTGPVNELVLLVLEYLEPSRVSAPDLHVCSSSRILNVP
jgi:hypothetical protein